MWRCLLASGDSPGDVAWVPCTQKRQSGNCILTQRSCPVDSYEQERHQHDSTLLLEWVERLAKDMKDGRPVLKKSVPLEEPLAVGNTRS